MQITLAYAVLSLLWFSLIVYAVFGGADFGAGIWDLVAVGRNARRQHALIDDVLGPVWETNHVWLVFLVVGLFSAFPSAFATLCIVLFVPLTLVVIGSVLRGSAFIFRTHGLGRTPRRIWNRVFSFASIMTPFFLGVSAAAVASGHIPAHDPQANLGSLWTTPFALTIGFMALALCATLAAIFLIVEASNRKDKELVVAFRWRALIAGAITAVLGGLGLLLAPSETPILWQGLLARAIPLVIATMLIGLATAVTVFLGYYGVARALIIVETAFILGAWGVSQIPYIIPPDVTVNTAAASPSTLLLLLIGIIVGMVIILPSIWYLFYIFKFKDTAGLFSKEG